MPTRSDSHRRGPAGSISRGSTAKNGDLGVAETRAKTLLKHVNFCNDPYRTLTGCDALIILTEWNEFRGLDKKRIKGLLKRPNVVDGRNVYDPGEMRRLGFNYLSIGRG